MIDDLAALEAAQLQAQRDGLERANEYFRQRETRTIAERLGLSGSIDTRIDYDIPEPAFTAGDDSEEG